MSGTTTELGGLSIAFCFAAIVWTCDLGAEVFFWKDERGRSYYSDRSVDGAYQISVRPGHVYNRVKKVFDGDTVLLEDGEKVRLLGINTPELESSDREGEALGKEAKQYLQTLIGGKKVRLETDITKHDKYQRRLAHVFTEDGEHVNVKLVQQGFAAVNIHPPDVMYLDSLMKSQQRAETRRIGIWDERKYPLVPIERVSEQKKRGWKRLLGKPRTVKDTTKYARLLFTDRIDVRIPKTNLSYFPHLDSYLGKELEVRGWVSRRKENYSILIRHPSALIVKEG